MGHVNSWDDTDWRNALSRLMHSYINALKYAINTQRQAPINKLIRRSVPVFRPQMTSVLEPYVYLHM